MKSNLLAPAAIGLACALAVAVPLANASPTDVSAARTAYAAKKAECKQRAKGMNFGMHWVKRNRWVKDCIAGAH